MGPSGEKDSGWDALKPGARGVFYLAEPTGPASSPPYFRLLKFVPAGATNPEAVRKDPPTAPEPPGQDEILARAKATMKRLEAQKAAGRRAEANRLQRELQALKKHLTAKQLEELEKEAPGAGDK